MHEINSLLNVVLETGLAGFEKFLLVFTDVRQRIGDLFRTRRLWHGQRQR